MPGAVADLVVVAHRTPDVYANLIGATERDIRLVLVGGAARYGTPSLMRQAGAAHPTPIRVAGRSRQIDYGDSAVTWPSIKAVLQAVQANPEAAADGVAATLAVWAGADLSQPNAPFILARHAQRRRHHDRGSRHRSPVGGADPTDSAAHSNQVMVGRRRRQPLPPGAAVSPTQLRPVAPFSGNPIAKARYLTIYGRQQPA